MNLTKSLKFLQEVPQLVFLDPDSNKNKFVLTLIECTLWLLSFKLTITKQRRLILTPKTHLHLNIDKKCYKVWD